MTGPIIPDELWPEGAHLHTWDSNGLGNWLRPTYGAWHLWASDIPLPAGHDWRVPVMRPTCKDSLQVAPAIDLERLPRYSHAASYDEKAGIAGSYMVRDAAGEWVRYDRLLALIDGSKNNNLPHVGDTNVVVSQPTKGEGVDDAPR